VRFILASTAIAAVCCAALGGCAGWAGRGASGATLVGGFPGAALGSVAARALDEGDRRQVAAALSAAPIGQSTAWRNRETGDSFTVTPTRSFETQGAACRDFRIEATVGGRLDGIAGSACRQDGGDWRLRE